MCPGALTLRHEGQVWDGFSISQGGTEMAAAHTAGQLGYLRPSGFPAWLQMGGLPVTLTALGGAGLRAESTLTDPDGAQWTLRRDFAPLPLTGTLAVTTTLSVNQSRALIHFPWLTLLPGLETFGAQKEQGLVAGIEYLENEPSSSEADVRGPGAIRRVPDPVKFTFPLMAILRGGNYLGLSWTPGTQVAALFDSPDRILPSGAQLMGLHAPNVGTERWENAPVAHGTIILVAGVPLVGEAAILGGGDAASVTPAIEHYVALRGLPPLPNYAPGFEGAARMLGRGWLDSAITTNGLVHHALPGSGFPATRAAEPGVHLRWLANQVSDQTLATRMRNLSAQIIARTQEINPGTGQPYDTIYSSSVSHVQLPIGAMLFGNLPQYVAQHLGQAAAFVTAFDANGLIHYVPAQDRPDFGVTHFATHANGQSSYQLQWIMNSVALSGDLTLTAQALDLLDKNWAAYGNSVPRGGQTWEVPLHTPDIIVAGHLCNANLMAYKLTREQKYLDRARYWAWTGVPFVYLAPPTTNPIGLYASIPVLGATWWGDNGAPNWIGLPVQWCGMVYAHALYRLAEIDGAGPWLQIARGMSFSGLQQSWPEDSHPDYMGTLPDSFALQTQNRNAAMINPGTMTADLPRAFETGAMYAQVTTPQWRWQLHAPAKITAWEEFATGVRFTIAGGWGGDSFRALVSNLPSAPLQVSRRAAGSTAPLVAAPHSFSASTRQLELQNITGATEFEIVMPFSHGVWSFDRPADFAGWQAAHDLTGGIISGGRMSLTLSGCDPFLHGPVVAFDAAKYRYIRVRMRNQTATSSGSLFWTTQRQPGFSPDRERGFAVVPNDGQTRDYVIDMQGRAGWEGTITQLRLDAVAGACSGRIEIDSIEVLKTLTPRSEVADWQVFQ